MEKLISIAVALVLIAASTGNLPRVIQAVHIAKFQLIKDSQASGGASLSHSSFEVVCFAAPVSSSGL